MPNAARARLPRRCRPPTPDLYTSRTLRRRHRSGARSRSLRRTISTPDQPLGRPGARFSRHSPFFIGATGAAGVALTYGLVHLLITAQSILILIGLALFLALGLDPITSWLVDRNLPRWLAVAVVFTVALAFAVGFFAVAIPPLVTQTEQLMDRAPDYLNQLQDHSSMVGKLNDRYHLQDRLTSAVNGSGQSIVNETVSAGAAIFDALGKFLILAVLTVYFFG